MSTLAQKAQNELDRKKIEKRAIKTLKELVDLKVEENTPLIKILDILDILDEAFTKAGSDPDKLKTHKNVQEKTLDYINKQGLSVGDWVPLSEKSQNHGPSITAPRVSTESGGRRKEHFEKKYGNLGGLQPAGPAREMERLNMNSFRTHTLHSTRTEEYERPPSI